MRPLLRIARTEVLEHLRQPWMVFILAANYLLWVGVFGVLFLVLEMVSGDPGRMALFRQQLDTVGVALDAFLEMSVMGYGTSMLMNLPLFVAFMSGTSVIHDRESGALPFLMLAPVTRRTLLLGKLVGAMAIPFGFHLVFVGGGSLLMGRFEMLAPFAQQFGGSSAWWIAYLLGAPLSAAFVGAIGTVISALSRDFRTSMQFTNFFIGVLGIGISVVLVKGVESGASVQLAYAIGCFVGSLLTLLLGARLISRDI